jgi:hypothetical protein
MAVEVAVADGLGIAVATAVVASLVGRGGVGEGISLPEVRVIDGLGGGLAVGLDRGEEMVAVVIATGSAPHASRVLASSRRPATSHSLPFTPGLLLSAFRAPSGSLVEPVSEWGWYLNTRRI